MVKSTHPKSSKYQHVSGERLRKSWKVLSFSWCDEVEEEEDDDNVEEDGEDDNDDADGDVDCVSLLDIFCNSEVVIVTFYTFWVWSKQAHKILRQAFCKKWRGLLFYERRQNEFISSNINIFTISDILFVAIHFASRLCIFLGGQGGPGGGQNAINCIGLEQRKFLSFFLYCQVCAHMMAEVYGGYSGIDATNNKMMIRKLVAPWKEILMDLPPTQR